MSADDYALIKRHPEGGFTVLRGFASDDEEPALRPNAPRFADILDALQAGINMGTEYGVQVDVELEDDSNGA